VNIAKLLLGEDMPMTLRSARNDRMSFKHADHASFDIPSHRQERSP